MSQQLIFQCPISKNRIELSLINDTVNCEYNYIDYEFYKAYFLLLKTAIEKTINDGYQKFNQLVTKDDYNNCLKNNDKWKIIGQDDILNTFTIQCNLNDALECILSGFEIK